MTSTNPLGATRVIVGVDTHRDEHVAVAIDCLGGRLGQRRLSATYGGYEELPLLGVWATMSQRRNIWAVVRAKE